MARLTNNRKELELKEGYFSIEMVKDSQKTIFYEFLLGNQSFVVKEFSVPNGFSNRDFSADWHTFLERNMDPAQRMLTTFSKAVTSIEKKLQREQERAHKPSRLAFTFKLPFGAKEVFDSSVYTTVAATLEEAIPVLEGTSKELGHVKARQQYSNVLHQIANKCSRLAELYGTQLNGNGRHHG